MTHTRRALTSQLLPIPAELKKVVERLGIKLIGMYLGTGNINIEMRTDRCIT